MITKTLRRLPGAVAGGPTTPVADAVAGTVADAVPGPEADEELQPTASGHPANTIATSDARPAVRMR